MGCGLDWSAVKWNLDRSVLDVVFIRLYFNVDLNSGPKGGAGSGSLPNCCVGVLFQLRRFSTPLLFSAELLLSNQFLRGELGIVVCSLTIRKTYLGAYPNCSGTQTVT